MPSPRRIPRKIPRQFFILAGLLTLTAVHVAWRALPSHRAPLSVADFSVGQPIPEFTTELLGVGPRTGAAVPRTGCRVIVAFSSTCPHCKAGLVALSTLPQPPRFPWCGSPTGVTVARPIYEVISARATT